MWGIIIYIDRSVLLQFLFSEYNFFTDCVIPFVLISVTHSSAEYAQT